MTVKNLNPKLDGIDFMENESETAWLVESFSGQHDRYLSGFSVKHVGGGFAYMPEWTANHMDALRFCRQKDAATIARVMPSYTSQKLSIICGCYNNSKEQLSTGGIAAHSE